MTVEEAIKIAENALNYQTLTKVQELIFRQVWLGLSYKEIAKNTGYDYDYIKNSAGELWGLLSEYLGGKVKKNSLKSAFKKYLYQSKMSFNRTKVIEVNLTGANLKGATLNVANLTDARLTTQSTETDLLKIDLQDVMYLDKNTGQEIVKDENNYHWNEWCFCSDTEMKIAQILDDFGLVFFPQAKLRMTTNQVKQNLAFDFLVCYQGKWGILQISEGNQDSDRDMIIPDVLIIQYYDVQRCDREPELVVKEFLQLLSAV
jgi:Pentapeptide repeats (8 copies)